MKKMLTLLTVLFVAQFAKAHCPIDLGPKYNLCAMVKWTKGPFMNMKSTERNLSEAEITLFKKGDSKHVPVLIPSLTIYPWMKMANSMEHGTRFILRILPNKVYRLSNVRFFMSNQGWFIKFAVNDGKTFDPLKDSFLETPIVFPGTAPAAPMDHKHDMTH